MDPSDHASWRRWAPDQYNTIIAVVEMSQSSWLIAGMLPALSANGARSWSRAQNGCFALLALGFPPSVCRVQGRPNRDLIGSWPRAFQPHLNRLRRLEHFRTPKWLRLLRPTPKGRHYSGIGGTGPAAILGGG